MQIIRPGESEMPFGSRTSRCALNSARAPSRTSAPGEGNPVRNAAAPATHKVATPVAATNHRSSRGNGLTQ
jgi:hypothetical protein